MSQLINIDKNFIKSSTFSGGGFAPGNTGKLKLLTDGIIPATDSSNGALQINNLDNGFTLTFTTKGSSKITIDEIVLHLTDATSAKPQICTITTHKKGGALLELVQETSLTAGPNRFVFSNPNHPVFKVSVIFTSGQFENVTLCLLGELEFFGQDLTSEFEFNDSVLETKAWNSSRYDGKQLSATTINEFNTGDISYAGTPVLQNYSRNIYLGSRVIGMGEKFESTIDDSALLAFPNFSYVVVKEYLTVNDDLSVTKHSVIGDVPGKTTRVKKGWYRAFYRDFPIKSSVSLQFFDENLETNVRPSYNIFFNGGQLQKLLHIRANDTAPTNNYCTTYRTGSNETEFLVTNSATNLGASFTIFNKENIIDTYFTGSLTEEILNISKPISGDFGAVADSTK